MNHDPKNLLTLKVGDPVKKIGGSYQAQGTVVAAFHTLAGEPRYVFEFQEPQGMLHIFGPSQLEGITNP